MLNQTLEAFGRSGSGRLLLLPGFVSFDRQLAPPFVIRIQAEARADLGQRWGISTGIRVFTDNGSLATSPAQRYIYSIQRYVIPFNGI